VAAQLPMEITVMAQQACLEHDRFDVVSYKHTPFVDTSTVEKLCILNIAVSKIVLVSRSHFTIYCFF